jgi:sugar phosphate permease
LNELSPDDARGTFPGFVYQLGNLIASVDASLQAGIAARHGGNYAFALAVLAGTVAIVIVIITALGIFRSRARPTAALVERRLTEAGRIIGRAGGLVRY